MIEREIEVFDIHEKIGVSADDKTLINYINREVALNITSTKLEVLNDIIETFTYSQKNKVS